MRSDSINRLSGPINPIQFDLMRSDSINPISLVLPIRSHMDKCDPIRSIRSLWSYQSDRIWSCDPTQSNPSDSIQSAWTTNPFRFNQSDSIRLNPIPSIPIQSIRLDPTRVCDSCPIRSNSPIPINSIISSLRFDQAGPFDPSEPIHLIRTDSSLVPRVYQPLLFLVYRVSGCINQSVLGCINSALSRVYQPYLSSLCHVLCVVSSLCSVLSVPCLFLWCTNHQSFWVYQRFFRVIKSRDVSTLCPTVYQPLILSLGVSTLFSL